MSREPEPPETGERRRLFARVEESVLARVRRLRPHEAARLARRHLAAAAGAEGAPELPPLPLAPPGPATSFETAALAAILARIERLERLVTAALRAHDADHGDEDDPGGGPWIDGETRSLSGGGAGIVLPVALEPGTPVEVELTLSGDAPAVVRAVGRVAHCTEQVALPARALAGIAFTAIHPADRETIVRYTFRVQRARLRERRQGGDSGPVL